MRVSTEVLGGLLRPPAPKPKQPTSRERAAANRLRVLQAVAEHGHLRCADLAAIGESLASQSTDYSRWGTDSTETDRLLARYPAPANGGGAGGAYTGGDAWAADVAARRAAQTIDWSGTGGATSAASAGAALPLPLTGGFGSLDLSDGVAPYELWKRAGDGAAVMAAAGIPITGQLKPLFGRLDIADLPLGAAVQGYVDEAGQRYADVTDPFRGTTQRITVANVRAADVAQLETVTVTGKRDMELARYEAMKDAVNRGERVDVDDMVQLGRRYDPTNPWVRNPTGREAMTGFITTVATGTAGLLTGGWAFGTMRTAGYGLTASGFTAGVVGDLTTQTLDNGVYFASSGGYGRRGINATELALSGGLGALPGVVSAGKGFVSSLRSGELGMFRRGSNTGAFADLPVLMDLKTVRSYAAEAGVGLDGVKVKIVRDESLVGKGVFGYAAPNGKSLTLYPDAFSSSEELVRTLGHERTHIYQARTFGPPQGIPELNLNEAAAYGLEDSFVKYWRSRGGH